MNSETESALPTKLKVLDDFLRGGIPSGSLTELVGQAGVGKTQFCHMLCVLATLPIELQGFGKDATVFYFDTENAFSSSRLTSIASFHHPDYFSNEQNIVDMVDRIVIFKPTSASQFQKELENLEEDIIEKNVRLIIIDSVASLVRKEFDRINLANRQMLLGKLSAMLKMYSETLNIPIVLTNQVTSLNDDQVTAALGNVWAHSINTRIVLDYSSKQLEDEYKDKNIRQMTIAKSPLSPVVTFPFYITEGGLHLIKQDESAEDDDINHYVINLDPNNYWNQGMFKKTNQPGSNPNTSIHLMHSHQK